MANFRKSFNFRNGVQVDDDNLLVDSVGKVGIGTTIPTSLLDVRGNAKVVGLVTTNNLFVTGVSTFSDVKIGSAIEIESSSGIVTATSFYGDGATLSNLPTSQWVDVNLGLGFTSIYAQGNVGVGTTNPSNAFQVGGDPYTGENGVGFSSVTGGVRTSGVITATSFVGSGAGISSINASYISTGTVGLDRLPVLTNAKLPTSISVSNITATTFSGNLTGNVTGDLTGNADTATNFLGNPNITVTSVGSTNISASGIITATTKLNVGTGGTSIVTLSAGKIGVGSENPTSDIQIKKATGSLLEVISDSGQARVSVGNSVNAGKSSGLVKFEANDLSLINNDNEGDINFLLNGNGSSGTGKFSWQDGSTFVEVMSLNSGGNFSVSGITTLASAGGITTTGGDFYVGNNLYVSGNIDGTVVLPTVFSGNVNATSGVSTFVDVTVSSSLLVGSGSSLGIGVTDPLFALDARNETALFGTIGIGTDAVYSGSLLTAYGNVIVDGSIVIGTTYINPLGGYVQLYAPLTEIYDGHVNLNSNSTVGFDTSNPKAVFDFSNVGAATTRPVMIVPNINNSTITGIAATPAGSVIFNTTTSKFQGYTGTAWVDFH